jgi:hypothetical protein
MYYTTVPSHLQEVSIVKDVKHRCYTALSVVNGQYTSICCQNINVLNYIKIMLKSNFKMYGCSKFQ